ncbi:glutaminase [Solitalea canadensis]|uniref:Glutaminase n=1 Tax=Solitalea canadensis (strain ATCC 29591 / DSM 3403 / JCM 21819 / LMG 8368 / NBRC 15130 / NCIMB 12057 / USAM 9D) TaxID=929556 RepID=H8KW57_SOLCM|nr:glutaminase [Solitalea canadensis]AFD07078.1 glutaminase A [Solitalea canadensis DSM 3403]
MRIDYQSILQQVAIFGQSSINKGKVADYIPELAKVELNHFGIAVDTLQGENFSVGDVNTKFSIQSISKVFSLTLAVSVLGEELWKRVGVEPSGNPFNSLVQLEFEKGIPRNPFINAGALVIADVIVSNFNDPKKEVLNFIRTLAGDTSIDFNLAVVASESEHGFNNRALVNFMKGFGNIHNDVETVLDLYFHVCSVEMTCKQLAKAFLLFANHGVLPVNSQQILTSGQAKRLNAIMLTCGFYDEAGEFAYRVGLPGKSGVGGGIAAFLPGELSVVTWSPGLNKFGNSVAGIHVLEMFTTLTNRSIF